MPTGTPDPNRGIREEGDRKFVQCKQCNREKEYKRKGEKDDINWSGKLYREKILRVKIFRDNFFFFENPEMGFPGRGPICHDMTCHPYFEL